MGPKSITLEWSVDGHTITQTFDLSRPLTIGRKESNDIVLDGGNISRSHASIFIEDAKVQLLNMSESNPLIFHHQGKDHPITFDEYTALFIDSAFSVGNIQFSIKDISFEKMPEGIRELVVKCEVCGRAVPVSMIHCPYDGWSLAGGQTFLGVPGVN
mgnify:CR=1 FL=1